MLARRHWGCPTPTDPDKDPLTVRVTGLPRSGEIRIQGMLVTPGAVFTVERFATATFKPSGTSLGEVGTFDILVEDGRGGSVLASLPISVIASNRPPDGRSSPPPADLHRRPWHHAAHRPGRRQAVRDHPGLAARPGALRRDHDPRGDRIQPEQLPALAYVPEPGFSGPAGTFRYLVEDGRGGQAVGSLDIEVMDPAEAAAQMAEAALWERLRASGRVEDVDTFLRLYPIPIWPHPPSGIARSCSRKVPPAPRRRPRRSRRRLPSRCRPRAPAQARRGGEGCGSPSATAARLAEAPKAPERVAALQPIVAVAWRPPPAAATA